MFEELELGSTGSTSEQQAFDLLQELERNTPAEVRRLRHHFRIAIKAAVVVQPGNASELMSLKIKGVTGDISEGGCSVLLPLPPRVGDIYRLGFDRKEFDLPLTFARCVRCRLIKEDTFEAGFSFFAPISLPERMIESAEMT